MGRLHIPPDHKRARVGEGHESGVTDHTICYLHVVLDKTSIGPYTVWHYNIQTPNVKFKKKTSCAALCGSVIVRWLSKTAEVTYDGLMIYSMDCKSLSNLSGIFYLFLSFPHDPELSTVHITYLYYSYSFLYLMLWAIGKKKNYTPLSTDSLLYQCSVLV